MPVPSPWAQGHGVVVVSVEEDRKIVAFSCTLTDGARTSRSLADTVYFLLSFLSPLPDSSLHSFLPSALYNPRLLSSFFPSREDGRLHGMREWDRGALVMGQRNPGCRGMREWDSGALVMGQRNRGCTGCENGTEEPWLHGMREWDRGTLAARDARMGQRNPGNGTEEPWLQGDARMGQWSPGNGTEEPWLYGMRE